MKPDQRLENLTFQNEELILEFEGIGQLPS